jgi:hypothetical protein
MFWVWGCLGLFEVFYFHFHAHFFLFTPFFSSNQVNDETVGHQSSISSIARTRTPTPTSGMTSRSISPKNTIAKQNAKKLLSKKKPVKQTPNSSIIYQKLLNRSQKRFKPLDNIEQVNTEKFTLDISETHLERLTNSLPNNCSPAVKNSSIKSSQELKKS